MNGFFAYEKLMKAFNHDILVAILGSGKLQNLQQTVLDAECSLMVFVI